MSGKAMSLKAKIRDIAKAKSVSAQVILQNYMFERFLERLSISDYKDNFILKGGMLIAAIVGNDQRSTMDIDATIKGYPISTETLTKAVTDIIMIDLQDNVNFSFSGISPIRNDDLYGGFRVSIRADYDTIVSLLQMDITTGDAITPKEVKFLYRMIFKDDTIGVWAYNIETVLAEKIETILQRGELNTRPRDFYDVYILTKTQKYDAIIFAEALKRTAEHRNTIHIFQNIPRRIESIAESDMQKANWLKYTKEYRYAADISYVDVIGAVDLLTRNI